MNKKVKNLLLAAILDDEFQNELQVHEPDSYKIKSYLTLNERIVYASIYMGWLIGKGRYNESDFT